MVRRTYRVQQPSFAGSVSTSAVGSGCPRVLVTLVAGLGRLLSLQTCRPTYLRTDGAASSSDAECRLADSSNKQLRRCRKSRTLRCTGETVASDRMLTETWSSELGYTGVQPTQSWSNLARMFHRLNRRWAAGWVMMSTDSASVASSADWLALEMDFAGPGNS